MADERLRVSVAYVGATRQILRQIEGTGPMRVRDAIAKSRIPEECPEIDLSVNQVGIFGKLAKLDQTLVDGDRVEIYRPLLADPKLARKQRAAEGKVLRKGGSAVSADVGHAESA